MGRASLNTASVGSEHRYANSVGTQAVFTQSATLRRLDAHDVSVLLYPADDLEDGLVRLLLRLRGEDGNEFVSLFGQHCPGLVEWTDSGPVVRGAWRGLDFEVAFRLAQRHCGWFWHIRVTNNRRSPATLDLLYGQDVALAPYDAVRTNEYYVSQYLDLTPVQTGGHGVAVGVRQNMPGARNPWAMVGALTGGAGWATDALQLTGRGRLDGEPMAALGGDLPSERLQHEHTVAAVQTTAVTLVPGETHDTGFWGMVLADHPEATSDLDARHVETVLSDAGAASPHGAYAGVSVEGDAVARSLFTTAEALGCTPLTEDELTRLVGPERLHAERDGQRDGQELVAFFTADRSHVVTAAKQRSVLRPHGHIMRTGGALTPDERAVGSTAWMAGTFCSQVTQGHASLDAVLSVRRTYLGLRQAHGLRIFVAGAEGSPWRLLATPSAWLVSADTCRWWYRHEEGLLEVTATAPGDAQEIRLSVTVHDGAAARLLVAGHIAFGGDDGAAPAPSEVDPDPCGVTVTPPTGSPTGERYPHGTLRLDWPEGTVEHVGDDAALFADGRSRAAPWVTVRTAPTRDWQLTVTPRLVGSDADGVPADVPASAGRPDFWSWVGGAVRLEMPSGAETDEVARLDQILPWFAHDAVVHYLYPRGLEQYTGGGWGTRDVSQGPVGLLLALNDLPSLRALVLRVSAAQNARGDWPQAFDFYPRHTRFQQGDSHGDVVYWPLLALADYLAASGDATLLSARVPYVGDGRPTEPATVLAHIDAALDVIEASRIPGTDLPAYGHGDWNDSLQPVDSDLARELCSTWTVTLQAHVLTTLSTALLALDAPEATATAERARKIADSGTAAMHELLLVDGLLAGYARFGDDGCVREHLVHPRDRRTGLRYSILPMIHAISADLLSAEQAAVHLDTIREHLLGPDGGRLFDVPARYRGGPMEVFQRAEASTFFGREIGVMYTHAHLRYAEALARFGDADAFLAALAKANPIGMPQRVPSARPRQSTCYYSSSDAVFADRYDAADHYQDAIQGRVALEGGWRVYSSGPGIFLRLVVENLLGLRHRGRNVEVDPVIPSSHDGLHATLSLLGRRVDVTYKVGERGFGPRSVLLNGAELELERLHNPYRQGGVSVDAEQLRLALRDGGNEMVVELS